jgi:type III restriction enzyme
VWETRADRCHVNYAVLDSGWEGEFCRVVESHPRVRAYVKNHNLGLEVPYLWLTETRRYIPDFIIVLDNGINLIVEIKGYRGEDAKEKKNTMDAYWIPGVNNLGSYGRWAFAEFTEVYDIEPGFNRLLESLPPRAATA